MINKALYLVALAGACALALVVKTTLALVAASLAGYYPLP